MVVGRTRRIVVGGSTLPGAGKEDAAGERARGYKAEREEGKVRLKPGGEQGQQLGQRNSQVSRLNGPPSGSFDS